MRLFLGSGGFSTEERRSFYAEQLREFLGSTRNILFVPYALHNLDFYTAKMNEAAYHEGLSFHGIHQFKDARKAIQDCEAIYVGGGNSFRLLHTLYERDLLNPIRKRVQAGEIPYLGVSAGSNMACPTLMTTNDMPIVCPPSFKALGLLNFQINPHYYSGLTHIEFGGRVMPYGGETRDDRLREYHEMNSYPVLGLWEGTVLRYESEQFSLAGRGGARLFIQGEDAKNLASGEALPEFLTVVRN